METRTARPKPKIDFTADALDFKNTNLLRQFVTDQGRILPRKYTGLPAHYQRRLTTRHQARAPDAADEVTREPLTRSSRGVAGCRDSTANRACIRVAGLLFGIIRGIFERQ